MSKWDELTMAEKAEMMKVAVRNGITNLNDIRDRYNEFAEGGSVDTDWSYDSWKRQMAEHMGIRPDEDNTYDYEAYFKKYPEEAYIALYFDGKNGSERKITLADKIDTEITRIEAIIASQPSPSTYL